MAEQLPSEQRVIRTAAGGWKYSDAVYNERWLNRVLSNVKQDENGCWIWQGFLGWKGYGQTNYRGDTKHVHRKVYEITHGVTLKTEEFVCHHCDVRACCNPAHLFVGDNSANQLDASRKGRHQETKKTHCPRNHPYDETNTYVDPRGLRQCRQCQRDRYKRYWREKPEVMKQRQRAYRARKKQVVAA